MGGAGQVFERVAAVNSADPSAKILSVVWPVDTQWIKVPEGVWQPPRMQSKPAVQIRFRHSIFDPSLAVSG
jgi:hypothetical protein